VIRSSSCVWLTSGLLCAAAFSVWGANKFNPRPASQEESSSVGTVGTSTDLTDATRTLLANFSRVAEPNATAIGVRDLLRAANSRDPHITKSVRDAAIFFVSSPVDRNFADVGDGNGKVDGLITKQGLQSALASFAEGQCDAVLLDTAAGNAGRDGIIGDVDYAAALRDPGVPLEVRSRILGRLSNARLLRIIGQPDIQGNAADKADELSALVVLARSSWLGAAEAEALARYRAPFRMDRGGQDRGYSYWDDRAMHISEKMTKNAAPAYISEVLAHEGGHAIFSKSGLKDRVYKDLNEKQVTPGMGNIVNEAFAGVFGNRTHIVLFGYKDQNIDRHLSLIRDVDDNIRNDFTFYAKRNRVNTALAREQIETIAHVMSEDIVPYLQYNFGLLGDPELTQGLRPKE
jgi:hypothetical protein